MEVQSDKNKGKGDSSVRINSENPFLAAIEKVVLENLQNEQFGVEDLAKEMNQSRFQIYRKLNLLTGRSISQFIREIRLNKARELLKEGNLTASEISYRVGFSSPAYFNKCFTDYFGTTPGELKKNETSASEEKYIIPNKKVSQRLPKSYQSSNIWRLFYQDKSLFFILIGLLLLLIPSLTLLIPRILPDKQDYSVYPAAFMTGLPEKSIAVMHFKNLSGEEENQYFTVGVMEAIKNHLSGIQDLRVSTGTATEQYRNSSKPLHEIGKELEVTYILEGSIQKSEDQLKITARILDVQDDQQIWSNQYTQPIQDIFDLTTQIAKDVASEIKVTLTPNEHTLLAKNSTVDIHAYDLYLRGEEYYANFFNMHNKEDLLRAENLYREAIRIDSTLALAYVGLGKICDNRHHFIISVSKHKEAYEDSILMYASKAISLDPYLADAYALRGKCYGYKKQINHAIRDQEKAISLNPNLAAAYLNLGIIWMNDKHDPLTAYKYLKTAHFYERSGTGLPFILWNLGVVQLSVENYSASMKYFRQMIQMMPGNQAAPTSISPVYWIQGKFKEALAYEDSCGISREEGSAGMLYYFMGKFKEALAYYERPVGNTEDKWVETDSTGSSDLAYMYLKTGRIMEGRAMLQQIITRLQSSKEKNHWGLAEAYAALGKDEKAVVHLLKEEELRPFSVMMTFLPHYHVFENLYENPIVINMMDRIKKRKEEVRKKIDVLEDDGRELLVSGI